MKITISVDVPTLEDGIAFYSAAFGFEEKGRPHPGYAVLVLDDVMLGLLGKPAGTTPAPGTTDTRKYDRHWTPVHADFRVDDFEATLAAACDAGATAEQIHRRGGFPPIAFCSDPFGNGFCIVGTQALPSE